ncbi:MAG: PAS domain-containing protein [Bacteroidetes bacterium]|nr:PAS domain-containing protein [Bacteroidota bacterium]
MALIAVALYGSFFILLFSALLSFSWSLRLLPIHRAAYLQLATGGFHSVAPPQARFLPTLRIATIYGKIYTLTIHPFTILTVNRLNTLLLDIWCPYVKTVMTNCLGKDTEDTSIFYWRNRLFAQILVYFLPLSILALIPGVFVSITGKLYTLAAVDATTFLVLLWISFSKKLSLYTRKRLFLALVYLIATTLFYYLGSYGPGMLYFLMGTLFSALIFAGNEAYWSVALNTLICAFFSICIYYHAVHLHLSMRYSLDTWIAVSSNLVMLSLVIAVLTPRLFQKMEESNKLYEKIARITNDTIWQWDIAADHMRYNTGIFGMFGYLPSETGSTQQWWMERIHPEDRERVEHEFSTFFLHTNFLQTEYRFRCADGTYKYVTNRATVMYDKTGGQMQKMVGTLQDTSKVRNYINAIEQQNNRLREIAWMQSHDARGPVATILGLSALLDASKIPDAETKEVIEGMVASAHKLDEVIRRINDMTGSIEEVRA